MRWRAGHIKNKKMIPSLFIHLVTERSTYYENIAILFLNFSNYVFFFIFDDVQSPIK